jgi:hypothetical protein
MDPRNECFKTAETVFLYTPRGRIDTRIDHSRRGWEAEIGTGRFSMP